MREIRNLDELEILTFCSGFNKPILLFISSGACYWCSEFKPVFKSIGVCLEKYYDACIITAENVGGREALREKFYSLFSCRYRGFPTLFMINGAMAAEEIPHEPVMWNQHSREFNKEAIISYAKEKRGIQ